MDREFQVKESFIKEAYQAACYNWKKKLERQFPDVLNKELKVGKWYTIPVGSSGKYILFIFNGNDTTDQKGFNADGLWSEKLGLNNQILAEEATIEVVREALINEAKKRGLVPGIYINSTWCKGKSFNKTPESYSFSFIEGLRMVTAGLSLTIFRDGVWAEPHVEKTTKAPAPIPTPEEITRVLDYLKSKQ